MPDEIWNIVHQETDKAEKDHNIKEVCKAIDVMVREIRNEFLEHLFDWRKYMGSFKDWMIDHQDLIKRYKFKLLLLKETAAFGPCNIPLNYNETEYYINLCKKEAMYKFIALSLICGFLPNLSIDENECVAQFRTMRQEAKDVPCNDYKTYYEEKLTDITD